MAFPVPECVYVAWPGGSSDSRTRRHNTKAIQGSALAPWPSTASRLVMATPVLAPALRRRLRRETLGRYVVVDAVVGPGATLGDEVLNPWWLASFFTAEDLGEEDTGREKAVCLVTIPALQCLVQAHGNSPAKASPAASRRLHQRCPHECWQPGSS